MGLFDRWFGKSKEQDTADPATYKIDGMAKCQKCGRSVKIQTPAKDAKGKILVASVDDMMPFAFFCIHCDYVTCARGSLLAYKDHNPRNGIPTCPSCKEVSGPQFFSIWQDHKAKSP